MEKAGLVVRHRGNGRSKVEVSLTEKGLDVFNQSLHNETDRKIFSGPDQEAARASRAVPVEDEEPDGSSTSASRNGSSAFPEIRTR